MAEHFARADRRALASAPRAWRSSRPTLLQDSSSIARRYASHRACITSSGFGDRMNATRTAVHAARRTGKPGMSRAEWDTGIRGHGVWGRRLWELEARVLTFRGGAAIHSLQYGQYVWNTLRHPHGWVAQLSNRKLVHGPRRARCHQPTRTGNQLRVSR